MLEKRLDDFHGLENTKGYSTPCSPTKVSKAKVPPKCTDPQGPKSLSRNPLCEHSLWPATGSWDSSYKEDGHFLSDQAAKNTCKRRTLSSERHTMTGHKGQALPLQPLSTLQESCKFKVCLNLQVEKLKWKNEGTCPRSRNQEVTGCIIQPMYFCLQRPLTLLKAMTMTL